MTIIILIILSSIWGISATLSILYYLKHDICKRLYDLDDLFNLLAISVYGSLFYGLVKLYLFISISLFSFVLVSLISCYLAYVLCYNLYELKISSKFGFPKKWNKKTKYLFVNSEFHNVKKTTKLQLLIPLILVTIHLICNW